jgi:hypothetical protein
LQIDPAKDPSLSFDTPTSAGDYENKVMKAGYRIFRLNIVIRSTQPLVISSLSETENARTLSSWTSPDGHTLSRFQSLFSILSGSTTKLLGVFNTRNSNSILQSRAFSFDSTNSNIAVSTASTFHSAESSLKTEVFGGLLRPQSILWRIEDNCTSCPFRSFDAVANVWRSDVTSSGISGMAEASGSLFKGTQVVQERFGSSIVRFAPNENAAPRIGSSVIAQLAPITVKAISPLPGAEGMIVRGVQGAEPDRYFYLKSAATPVLYSLTLDSQDENVSGDPSTKFLKAEEGGVFLTAENRAPNQSGTCLAAEVEFLYLFITTGSQDENIKFGCLNTSSGVLTESQNSINGKFLIPLNKANAVSAGLDLKHHSYLFPKWTSASKPSTGIFIMLDPGRATFSSIDLHALPASINAQVKGVMGGYSGARFDALACIQSESSCYAADSANKIVWKLK